MCLIKGLRRVLPLRFSNVSSQHTLSHTQSGHSRRIERKSKVSQSRPRTNRPTRPKQVDNLNMPNHLVRFYDPEVRAKDPKGRTVDSILAWDDDRLETAHDYIQILFPLPEYSPYNSWAPAIDRTTFNAFRQRKALRDNLTRSFERMLDFYGFTLEKYGGKVEVCQSPGFPEASQTWLAKYDHNHLRMTRIIRSLRVLGLEMEAQAFYVALREVYRENPKQINEKSLMFWRRAAERPLYLAPEDDEDEGDGQDYLYELAGISKSSSGEEEDSEEEEKGKGGEEKEEIEKGKEKSEEKVKEDKEKTEEKEKEEDEDEDEEDDDEEEEDDDDDDDGSEDESEAEEAGKKK